MRSPDARHDSCPACSPMNIRLARITGRFQEGRSGDQNMLMVWASGEVLRQSLLSRHRCSDMHGCLGHVSVYQLETLGEKRFQGIVRVTDTPFRLVHWVLARLIRSEDKAVPERAKRMHGIVPAQIDVSSSALDRRSPRKKSK